MILGGKIHQSGGSSAKRNLLRRFFYALLVGEAYQIGKSWAMPTGCAEDGDGTFPSTSAPDHRAGVLIGAPALRVAGFRGSRGRGGAYASTSETTETKNFAPPVAKFWRSPVAATPSGEDRASPIRSALSNHNSAMR